MSDERSLSIRDLPSLLVPAFGTRQDGTVLIKQQLLPLDKMKLAESRVLETRTVNPATYNDLEYTYSMAYGELKNNFADLGLLIARASNELENIKAKLVLEKYPEYLVGKPRSADTPDARRSFVQLDPDFQKAQTYVNLLTAYEKLIEGRMKFVEKVSAYMKKQIDITIRSGSSQIFNTQGRR